MRYLDLLGSSLLTRLQCRVSGEPLAAWDLRGRGQRPQPPVRLRTPPHSHVDCSGQALCGTHQFGNLKITISSIAPHRCGSTLEDARHRLAFLCVSQMGLVSAASTTGEW